MQISKSGRQSHGLEKIRLRNWISASKTAIKVALVPEQLQLPTVAYCDINNIWKQFRNSVRVVQGKTS